MRERERERGWRVFNDLMVKNAISEIDLYQKNTINSSPTNEDEDGWKDRVDKQKRLSQGL